MSRITDNEAIREAKILEEYCMSKSECDGCVFSTFGNHNCTISEPYDWIIPDPAPEETEDSKRIRERQKFFGGGAAW